MAIGFARFAFVKRSQGKNACQKSAYNSRSLCEFEGTKYQEPCTYSFMNCRDGTAYSEVFIPDHVDEKFKNREYLWNAVEKFENRKDSQVCWEMVFALPDDPCVTLEDKIELCQRFVKECFVSYGSAVQVDIHYPKGDKNWHAHFIGTLREFDESGKDFQELKMRDGFIPAIRNGRPMFPENWVKYAVDLQNSFFKEKAYDISVDPSGAISQKHIGPERFRGRCQSLIEENELRKELNQESMKNPETLLELITKSHSVFDCETVDFYVQKIDGLSHVEQNLLIQDFWKQEKIIPLFKQKSGEFAGKYTIQSIVEEEKSIVRNAERLKNQDDHKISFNEDTIHFAKHLRSEQKEAFKKTIEGDGIVCINGLAGTGKSTLLEALKNLYEDKGYVVRGMGPDIATCAVLREKGFESSENIHRFLFNQKYSNREIKKGAEVWIVDESSKIGNAPIKELLKVAVSNEVKVIFTGDISQLSPVERGTAFTKFCENFGYIALENVQRQEKEGEREIVKLLSGINGEGSKVEKTHKAIEMMANYGIIKWDQTKIDSIKSLVGHWAKGKALDPQSNSLILALKKEEVQVLNDVVRLYRKRCGELGDKDYLCQAPTGTFVLSEGDHILFKQRNELLGIENGDRGTIKKISPEQFSVEFFKKGGTVEFSPQEYSHFQLGYVSTNFAAQGSTFDRVYVMGSPQMRQEAYYVASSRHTKSLQLFITKEEIENIATLKKLASRSIQPSTTIGFFTKEAIEAKQKLEGYKNSNSIFKRAYGKAHESVSKWDIWSRSSDLLSDNKFYRPEIDRTNGISLRIIDNVNEYPTRVITNNAYIASDTVINLEGIDTHYNRKILNSTQLPIVFSNETPIVQEIKGTGVIERPLGSIHGYEFIEDLYKEIESIKSFKNNAPGLTALSFEKANLVSEYHLSLEACNKMSSQGTKFSSKEWKQAVANRNKEAHTVTNCLSKEELVSIFDTNKQKELRSFSQKQQSYLKRNQKQEALLRKEINPSFLRENHEIILPELDLQVKGIQEKGDKFKQTPKLSQAKQKLIDDYKRKSIHASTLYKKGELEVKERGVSFKNTSVAKEFMLATSIRNEAAYNLNRTLIKTDLAKIFTDTQILYIKNYAEKFEKNRTAQQQNSAQNIENKLRLNMESLCQNLFPDIYCLRSGATLRFGNNGSLSVNVSGRYVGTYKDFEKDESGGPISLIQKAKGFNFPDSMKYAKEFLSIPSQSYTSKVTKEKPENSWVSVIPPANSSIPPLEKVNKDLAKDFHEVARHDYRDEKGNLLFCILRLEPNEGGSKKIRPLSYGFDPKNPSKKYWRTVGYKSESKAIYGLEKLYSNPNAPILIVEGEKTADSASKLFEKEGVIAITWVGGTGSVNKVDWRHLKGRDVTIWPDNDKAGIEAANIIVSGLRKLGVNSLKLVDPTYLEKSLPPKWDLADEVPKNLKQSFVRDAFRNATEKNISLNSLISSLKVPKNIEEAAVFKSFALEILSGVDNRLREDLEKKHGNKTWEIKNQILQEASIIINSRDEISKKLEKSGITGNINERLTAQCLYIKSASGLDPTTLEIAKMNSVLKEIGQTAQNTHLNSSISNHTFDKAFFKTREFGQFDLSTQFLKTALNEQAKTETKVVSDLIQRDLSFPNQVHLQQRSMDM
jgi:Ti-type conjugative transfer relaxase TraA